MSQGGPRTRSKQVVKFVVPLVLSVLFLNAQTITPIANWKQKSCQYASVLLETDERPQITSN